jgi:hypothetical protein
MSKFGRSDLTGTWNLARKNGTCKMRLMYVYVYACMREFGNLRNAPGPNAEKLDIKNTTISKYAYHALKASKSEISGTQNSKRIVWHSKKTLFSLCNKRSNIKT